MEWWHHALLSFGEKGRGNNAQWSCIICKESQFSNQDKVQEHLKSHKVEEFKRLKFEVKVQGLSEDDWDTLPESGGIRDSLGEGNSAWIYSTKSEHPSQNMKPKRGRPSKIQTDINKPKVSELPSASRKSTRQRKRVSLDGFLMTGYNREASSEDHSSLSIKKAKIESIGCKEDPENTDIEETISEVAKKKQDQSHDLVTRSRSNKTASKPQKSTISTLSKKKSKPRMDKIEKCKEPSIDTLEAGLQLILEKNYTILRAATTVGVARRHLKQYIRGIPKEGELKRVVPCGNALELGLYLILVNNYCLSRAAASADVDVADLQQYARDKPKITALKRVVNKGCKATPEVLETGLRLVVEKHYYFGRAADAVDVDVSELKRYARDRQKQGALKREVISTCLKKRQQFHCLCKKRFYCMKDFYLHIEHQCKFRTKLYRKCSRCKLPLWDEETYLEHFDKEHSLSHELFQCNYCPEYKVRKSRLIMLHMKYYHGISLTKYIKGVFKCKHKNCDYETFDKACQRLHHKAHKLSQFICYKCGDQFKTYTEAQIHRKVHRDTNSICNLCGEEFEEVPEFKKHMLVHNENALVPGYTKTKVSYFEDGETENPSKVFVCDMCEDFQTNTHYKLTMHKLRKHPKDRVKKRPRGGHPCKVPVDTDTSEDAESNDENTGSDMNTDGEKCVLDADTHDDDFPSDARSIMDNGSDTESYDDNYSSDADSNDEDCPTADKDSDNRCGTSEALLDSCSRGPAEKEAIEVLMNCLGKSVRHSPCDKNEKSPTPKKKRLIEGKAGVTVHLKKSNQLVFACDLCKWEASEHQSYHNHLLLHSSMIPVNCWYCDKMIGPKTVSQDTDEFKCEVCEETFTQNSQLANHIRDTDHYFTSKNFNSVISLNYTCFICSMSFASEEELDVHLQSVHSREIQDKTEKDIDTLKQEMISRKSAVLDNDDLSHFACHICQYKSAHHFNFHRHMLTHTLGKNYQCTHCSKVISAVNSKTGYGQIIYTCEDCNKIFHTKLKYKEHRFEVHSETSKGTKRCKICGFVSWSKLDITKHHMRAHATEKFELDEISVLPCENKASKIVSVCGDCGFSSDRKDAMEKHRLTHIPLDQREVYKCDECDFSSYMISSLHMHMSTKHRQKITDMRLVMYKCDLCMEYKSLLKQDVLTHKARCIRLFVDKEDSADENSQGQKGDQEKESETTEIETREKKDSESPGSLANTSQSEKSRKKYNDANFQFRYVCDLCEMVFTRPWNLKRHKEMSHVKYHCHLCQYTTKNVKYLPRHYENAHCMEAPDDPKPVREEPQQAKERLTHKDIPAIYMGHKKERRLSGEQKVNCEHCGLELTKSTLKPHINRKHPTQYECVFQHCAFSTFILDDMRGHIIQNHLQEHTVAALDVLNDLLRDKQPSNTSATSSAQLMCTDCHYQTTSLDNMNTHKTTGSVLCGATILKLTEPDMLSPCSQCNFHPSSLQDKVTHLIKDCTGKDLYHLNELMGETEGTQSQLMDVTEPAVSENTTLYPVNFINQSAEPNPISNGNPPSYTEAVSQKITRESLSGLHLTPEISQEITTKPSALQNTNCAETVIPGFDQPVMKESINIDFNTDPYSNGKQLKDLSGNHSRTSTPHGNELVFIAKGDMLQQYGELIGEDTDIMNKTSDAVYITDNTCRKPEKLENFSNSNLSTDISAQNADLVRQLFEEIRGTSISGGNKEKLDVFDSSNVHNPTQQHLEQIAHLEAIQQLEDKTAKRSIDSESETSQNIEKETRQKLEGQSEIIEKLGQVTETQEGTNSSHSFQLSSQWMEHLGKEAGNEGQITGALEVNEGVGKNSLTSLSENTNITLQENSQCDIVVDKKTDDLTYVTVPNGESEICFEIRGQLNTGTGWELPSNLYSLISEVLNKQKNGVPSSDVVYCDIIVNNDD